MNNPIYTKSWYKKLWKETIGSILGLPKMGRKDLRSDAERQRACRLRKKEGE